MKSFKTLYVFVAHIDDLEFSCLGYLLNTYYNRIKIVIATTWEPKAKVFEKNDNQHPLPFGVVGIFIAESDSYCEI